MHGVAAEYATERTGHRVRARVASGELLMNLEREDIPLEQALSFGTRQNVRRSFLFVSRLLGRHMPTRPAVVRESAALLVDKLSVAIPRQACVFVGMAETATTLGQAVFREWRRRGGRGLYLDTTRRRTGGRIALAFTEEHSHAPEHLLHAPTTATDPESLFGRAATLVIVDDELTTGRTVRRLAAAYRVHANGPVDVHVATLASWQEPPDATDGLAVHSLIKGTFTFNPDPEYLPTTAPAAMAPEIVLAPHGTRHGIVEAQVPHWPEEVRGRVLVVGAGEFGFVPFAVAEQVEAAGGTAFVQATTRSPVALGGAIQHSRCFPALSGEGYAEFLYNVPDEHSYDRVLVCVEDRVPPRGHPLRALPRVEWRVAGG